ncbi:hypothetical protein BJY04DRAFT_202357 [Aspergillus karnatakaensis]|uniref:uncharacterized protein n=1 Tax=Aspergillus karnatakaensis TaxID=1810916 RepID=UPI003CCE1044
MFGWSSALGLPAIGSEPENERTPPPPPTTLDFPIYRLPDVPDTPSEESIRNVHVALASIRRPQDICPEKFKDLNLKVETDVPLSSIVLHNGAPTAPPLPWELDLPKQSLGHPASADGTPTIMDNENPYPPKDKFDLLEQELRLDNDDAFREVARLPPRAGRERVRVTQTRKFWTALERMSQYWDDSLDEYYERPKSPEPEEEETPARGGREATPMDVDKAEDSSKPQAEPELVKKYKGRRVAAGQDMPEEIRDEVVRALTEMAAWPFGCQVSLPVLPPRLAMNTLLFPVRQTFMATRSPKDRQLARNGMLEGPVFVAQCRPETVFRAPEQLHGFGIGDICDLVREVGTMLLAAQERAREGEVETRPGEGKWWTTVPRWGGAPNDAIGDSVRVTNEQEKEAAASGRKRSRSSASAQGLLRRPTLTRKMSSSDYWRIVQPGSSLWDKRLRYIQIGRDRDTPYDDIYMLSSINHHLCILHLRIHRRYLDIVTNGSSSVPPDSSPDQPWHVLNLRRTRWYDLFDADDRVDVFKGIWTIFHCSLRKF